MKKLFALAAILLLLGACAGTNRDKTPQTRSGQLNTCMLREVYELKDSGRLSDPKLNEDRLARQILALCRSRLDITSSEFNAVQSLAIVTSTIRAVR